MTQLFPIPYVDSIPDSILARAERTYREALALLEDTDIAAGAELQTDLSSAIEVLRLELGRRSPHATRSLKKSQSYGSIPEPPSYTYFPKRIAGQRSFQQMDIMYTTTRESSDVLADRPPVQHTTSFSMCAFGDEVREDLDDLAYDAVKAIRHCDDLSRSAPALCSLDMQRDVLHLQARIAGLARQIADARQTLERMQKRTAATPYSRPQLNLPLS